MDKYRYSAEILDEDWLTTIITKITEKTKEAWNMNHTPDIEIKMTFEKDED